MISYGVSSYGYDLRIADEFKIFTNINNTIVDPNGNEQLLFYQVNMTLISLSDNRKVWVGQKDIRKLVTRSKMRF